MSSITRRTKGGATAPSAQQFHTAAPSKSKVWNISLLCACGFCTAACIILVLAVELTNSVRFSFELHRVASEVRALRLTPGYLPVLVPAYKRPEYLRQVLDGMLEAEGIEETVVIISQDGADAATAALIEQYESSEKGHIIKMWHTQPYLNIVQQFWATDAPTAANVKYLLRLAFDYLQAPGAIVIESDIQPSKDFYRYFQWAAWHTGSSSFLRQHTFTVNGYHHESLAEGSPYKMSVDHYGFTVWGWFCPAASWPVIAAHWTWYHNWDITMEHSIRRRPDNERFLSLTPQISRVRNIGMNGINFKGGDAAEEARWLGVPVPHRAFAYKDDKNKWLPMQIVPHQLGPKPVGTAAQQETVAQAQRTFET